MRVFKPICCLYEYLPSYLHLDNMHILGGGSFSYRVSAKQWLGPFTRYAFSLRRRNEGGASLVDSNVCFAIAISFRIVFAFSSYLFFPGSNFHEYLNLYLKFSCAWELLKVRAFLHKCDCVRCIRHGNASYISTFLLQHSWLCGVGLWQAKQGEPRLGVTGSSHSRHSACEECIIKLEGTVPLRLTAANRWCPTSGCSSAYASADNVDEQCRGLRH